MRLFFSFIFILLVHNYRLFAQPVAYPQLTLKTAEKKGSKTDEKFSSVLLMPKDTLAKPPLQNLLPLNFYSQHLGAACKMELHLEKQTRLPIRIRLGSKEQVDYLEGKFSRNQ